MDIPTDRPISVYYSRQRGRGYWYALWTDENGRTRKRYIGRELPTEINAAWIGLQYAEAAVTQAVRKVFAGEDVHGSRQVARASDAERQGT